MAIVFQVSPCGTENKNNWTIFKGLFYSLGRRSYRERQGETDFPPTSLFPQMKTMKARSQSLPHGWQRPKHLATFHCVPRHISRESDWKKSSWDLTGIHTGITGGGLMHSATTPAPMRHWILFLSSIGAGIYLIEIALGVTELQGTLDRILDKIVSSKWPLHGYILPGYFILPYPVFP